jgi:hypothetical protein
MAWQYSNALNGALLAASNGGQSDTLGLGATNSLYKPYFSSYDPFTSRYQPRASNFFERRSPPSIFDDLELELEVDDSILSSTRYRQPLYSNHHQPAYVPSYFNSLKTSLNNQNRSYDINNNNNNNLYSESINEQVVSLNNLEQLKQNQQSNISNDNLTQKSKPTYANKPKKANNNINTTATNKNQTKKQVNPNLASKIQPAFNTNSYQSQHQQQQQQQIINNNPTPNFQRLFQPIPFQNETPTIMNNINSVESSADLGSISNHNNQQLRFLQYQQRLLQQQEMNKNQSLSELEILKLKQQQDKQQLMQAIAANNNSNNNAIKKGSEKNQQYQPFFEEHHLKQKQYSETSIPSTNADPLYSNSPTPPLGVPNHRLPRVNFDTNPVQINKQTNNNTKMAQTKKGFYFKLNENNTNNIKSSDDLPEIGKHHFIFNYISFKLLFINNINKFVI